MVGLWVAAVKRLGYNCEMIERPQYVLDMSQCYSVTLLLHGCVCSQGHAAPALYSMWTETGFLKESELLSLCQVDSTLEGHPTPVSDPLLTCNLLTVDVSLN